MNSFPAIHLGRYVAGDSPLHRLDPRTKLLAYAVLSATLFTVNQPLGLAIVALSLSTLARVAGLPLCSLLRGLIPFLWLFSVTGLTHLFSTGGVSLPLFPVGTLDATWEGLRAGLMITAKLALMVGGSVLLTSATLPSELAFAIERFLAPLRLVGVNVGRWAAMLSLSIIFIPMLQEEADRLMDAHKSRGMAPNDRNLIERGREMSPLVPLLFSRLFLKANQMGEAFAGRGFDDSNPVGTLQEPRFHRRDIFAGGITTATVVLILSL